MTKDYKKTIDILTNEALPKREKEFNHLKAKLLIKGNADNLKKTTASLLDVKDTYDQINQAIADLSKVEKE